MKKKRNRRRLSTKAAAMFDYLCEAVALDLGAKGICCDGSLPEATAAIRELVNAGLIDLDINEDTETVSWCLVGSGLAGEVLQ